jgi:hypothetical protein
MCENTEKRICMKFYFKIGKTATETYQLLRQAFGEETMGRTQVFDWFRRFKENRISESRRGVVLQPGGWARWQQPLSVKKRMLRITHKWICFLWRQNNPEVNYYPRIVRIVKRRIHFLTRYFLVLEITANLIWIPFVSCNGLILIVCHRNAILYFSLQGKMKLLQVTGDGSQLRMY